MTTFLLGAEGCAELTNEPWLRDATFEETVRFTRRYPDMAWTDGMGRPYWLKTVTDDAPGYIQQKAATVVRTVRLTE